MSNVLSRVERSIMIKYLQDNLPKIMIKAISTKYIPSEQNSPSFDPLDLDEKKYSILDQGIIFFTRKSPIFFPLKEGRTYSRFISQFTSSIFLRPIHPAKLPS